MRAIGRVIDQELYDEYVPHHLHEGLRAYIEEGRETGHFLQAVIKNDLKGACALADHVSQRSLARIVEFMYNYAPSPCWGSPEKYEKWVKNAAEFRINV